MGEFDYMQDVVGQLPFLKTYSHLLLAFPLPDQDSCREDAKQRLQAAALRLTEAFPWLAAKVTQRHNGPDKSDSFHLQPCELWSPPNSIIRFKDCSDVMPCFQELVAARGPASMLPGELLGPRKAFPESYQESDQNPAPVIAFQANFVSGGLLLDCAAQHNYMDMSGIEQCYSLLATALRGESFPRDAIVQGNMDRRYVLNLLQEHEALLDHGQFLRPRPEDPPVPPPVEPESPFSWRYFRFSPAKLAALKEIAAETPSTKTNGDGPSSPQYVSTNDALTAFCWQRVIAARLARRQTPEAVAKFCRAVDARRTMGVPKGYMGDLVTIATSTMGFRELAEAPLAEIASRLRRDLSAVNNYEYVRSFATWIERTADKSVIAYGGGFNPDTDIGSSSWAHIRLAKVAFGPLGRPSLIRRPDFVPLKSDIYFMPQTEMGDIDALVCFNHADLNGLMEDEIWNAYTDCIG
ncbi:transferase family-domain-containing protein [Diaporthe sp. PMI_573]|nr:transferase family-domain-containing protein [Diaporthaceae sp. PMI_573]